MADNLLIINWALNLYLLGLIWTIQLVHYPSFRYVEKQKAADFFHFHQKQMSLVVAIPMILELVVTVLLLTETTRPLSVLNMVLVLVIWATTFLVSVPCHKQLLSGYDENVIDRLIHTNWIRTISWSVKFLNLSVLIFGEQL